jgi:hypothetical protein
MNHWKTLAFGISALWVGESFCVSPLPSNLPDINNHKPLRISEALDDLSSLPSSSGSFLVEGMGESPAQCLDVPDLRLIRKWRYSDDGESRFVLNHLDQCTDLTELFLDNTPQEEILPILDKIACLPKLIFLSLSGLTVTREIISKACQLPILKVLSLCGVKMDVPSFLAKAMVLSNPNLVSVILDEQSDKSLRLLEKYTKAPFRMEPLTEEEWNQLLKELQAQEMEQENIPSRPLTPESSPPVVFFAPSSRRSSLSSENSPQENHSFLRSCCTIL